MAELQFENGTLVYEVNGSGPDLVFVHGFSLDRRSWAEQVERFSKSHRVITYDLRGFGQSSLPAGDYDHVRDLKALFDITKAQNPVLCGLSLGANIANAFANQHADLLGGLVLASPGSATHVWDEERPTDVMLRIALSEGIEAAKAAWLAHPMFKSLDRVPFYKTSVTQQVKDYSAWHWETADRPARISPPKRPLEEINLPVLVISGGLDVKGYRDIALNLSQRYPNAEYHFLPEGGHMINLDSEDEFDSLLAAFCARLGR